MAILYSHCQSIARRFDNLSHSLIKETIGIGEHGNRLLKRCLQGLPTAGNFRPELVWR